MNAEGILLAAGAVIHNDAGQILLVRHHAGRESYWRGKWICPGGKLEAGETLAAGAQREVLEETHLEIRLERMLPPFETIVKDQGKLILHVVYVDFVAHVVGGNLQPDDDVAEAQWWSRAEMKRRKNELHQDTRRLMHLAGVLNEEEV